MLKLKHCINYVFRARNSIFLSGSRLGAYTGDCNLCCMKKAKRNKLKKALIDSLKTIPAALLIAGAKGELQGLKPLLHFAQVKGPHLVRFAIECLPIVT